MEEYYSAIPIAATCLMELHHGEWQISCSQMTPMQMVHPKLKTIHPDQHPYQTNTATITRNHSHSEYTRASHRHPPIRTTHNAYSWARVNRCSKSRPQTGFHYPAVEDCLHVSLSTRLLWRTTEPMHVKLLSSELNVVNEGKSAIHATIRFHSS